VPFVKIHISDSIRSDIITILARDVKAILVEVLMIEETIGQVMVYQTPVECRCTHSSRDINFVFTEITMYPGRTAEMKKKLMERVNLLVHSYLDVDQRDINGCIIEVPAENWSGGVTHKYILEPSE